MEIFVFVLSVVALFFVAIPLSIKLLQRKKPRYIKRKSRFLFMHNSGKDLCEKGQKIVIKHHYIQKGQPLVFEV